MWSDRVCSCGLMEEVTSECVSLGAVLRILEDDRCTALHFDHVSDDCNVVSWSDASICRLSLVRRYLRVALALAHSHSLTTLKVLHCSPELLVCIVEGLKYNRVIRYLKFGECGAHIDNDTGSALAEVVRRSNVLHCFKLDAGNAFY